jgi:hypothetical protein
MSLMPPDPAADLPETSPVPPADLATRPIRWLRAVVAGVIVAGVTATAAWFVIPATTTTAQTLHRVPLPTQFVFRLAEPAPSLDDHLRTQVALVRSRPVLLTALKRLKQFKERDHPILQSQPDPVDWLEQHVQVDFSLAPEILRIAVTGDDEADLVELANAIREAYVTEVLDCDRHQLKNRLAFLEQSRQEYAARLRAMQEEVRRLNQEAGLNEDGGVRGTMLAFRQMQLARAEHDLVETQASLLRNRAELAVLRKVLDGPAMSGVSDAEVQAELAADPEVRAAQSQVDRTRDRVEQAAAASKPGEPDPSLPALRKQLSDEQAAVAAVTTRLTPGAVGRIRVQRRKATAEAISRLEVRTAVDEETEKVLTAQGDRLRDGVQQIMKRQARVSAEDDATAIRKLQEISNRIAAEAEKLRFELKRPTGHNAVIEQATVHRTTDVNRLLMATAGTFVGTFAIVLLGFAMQRFRVPRIDTSANE